MGAPIMIINSNYHELPGRRRARTIWPAFVGTNELPWLAYCAMTGDTHRAATQPEAMHWADRYARHWPPVASPAGEEENLGHPQSVPTPPSENLREPTPAPISPALARAIAAIEGK